MSPLEQAGTVIAVGLTSVLVVPRISPIRALFLGFRSLIRGPKTKSLRSNDVFEIRKRVNNNENMKKLLDEFVGNLFDQRKCCKDKQNYLKFRFKI